MLNGILPKLPCFQNGPSLTVFADSLSTRDDCTVPVRAVLLRDPSCRAFSTNPLRRFGSHGQGTSARISINWTVIVNTHASQRTPSSLPIAFVISLAIGMGTSDVFGQSHPSTPPQRLKIESLLEIQPLVEGRTLPPKTTEAPRRSTSANRMQEEVHSEALSALLSSQLPSTGTPSVPATRGNLVGPGSTTSMPDSSRQGWTRPMTVASPTAPNRGDNPLREGAVPLRTAGATQNAGASISNLPNRHQSVSPVGYQNSIPTTETEAVPLTPPASRQPAMAPEPITPVQDRPRTLNPNDISGAVELTGNAPEVRQPGRIPSLEEAIPSPNLLEDPTREPTLPNQAPPISQQDLDQLKKKVTQTAATGATAGFALPLTGPTDAATTNAAFTEGDPELPNQKAPQQSSESDNRATSEVNSGELDQLIDGLKARQDQRTEIAIEVDSDEATMDPDVISANDDLPMDAETVPTFQPYAGQPDTLQRDTTTANVPIETLTSPWLKLPLLDYPAIRQHIRETHVEQGPQPDLLLAEAQYTLIRGQVDKASEALSAIDRQQLSFQQQWLWSWLQAQLAIETSQEPSLRAALDQMQQFPTNDLTRPFLTYTTACLATTGEEPNYSQAVTELQACLQQIQSVESQANVSGFASLLDQLRLDCHLAIADNILRGPYVRAQETADRWFEAAQACLQYDPRTRTAALKDTYCLLKQLEIKAASRQVSSIPVEWAFLQTRIARWKSQWEAEDAEWLEERVASLNYDSALAYFQQEDFSKATQYLDQSIQWYQSRTGKGGAAFYAYHLARCYWLAGALEDFQGHPLAALQQYERFVQNLPNDMTASIAADQANQGERLGTVAVAYWKQGQKQRAVQMAEAAVAQMLVAVDQGLAPSQRSERLEKNLATMQFQLTQPETGPADNRTDSTGNAVAGGNGNRIPALSASSATSRGSTPANITGRPQPQAQPSGSSSIGTATGGAKTNGSKNGNPPDNPSPENGQRIPESDVPIKSFWKKLFSSQRNQSTTPGSRQATAGQ